MCGGGRCGGEHEICAVIKHDWIYSERDNCIHLAAPPNSGEWPLLCGIPINQLSTGKQLPKSLSQLSPLLPIVGSQEVLRGFAKRGFALWLRGRKKGLIIFFHLITFSETDLLMGPTKGDGRMFLLDKRVCRHRCPHLFSGGFMLKGHKMGRKGDTHKSFFPHHKIWYFLTSLSIKYQIYGCGHRYTVGLCGFISPTVANHTHTYTNIFIHQCR